eukprot:g74701.t1
MDTPSDSDFDDCYDEVTQDLFSEEMESMKKLEQERAIEKNGEAKEEDEETEDQEDKNIDVQKDEEDENEEEDEEEVAAALGTNGGLGYWSLSELSDKDFEKGEICAERCCRINKPKVSQAPQRMKTLRWKHEFFLAQKVCLQMQGKTNKKSHGWRIPEFLLVKGSESMPTLRVCFYNEKEEKKFWGIPGKTDENSKNFTDFT